MTRTVLVTGGSGAIGQRIVTRLHAEGWRVRALAHRRAVHGADDVRHGSILDPIACATAVAGCDAVVHAAGTTHARTRRAYERTNVIGTRHVLAAAVAAGVRRLVFISSRTAGTESGWYGAAKLEAERLVETSGLAWTIVRLPEVYGAHTREGVDDVIARARGGRLVLVPGAGESELCPMHIDDAVGACISALGSEGAIGKVYVVGGPCLSLRAFAEHCIAASASRSRIVGLPWPLLRAAAAAARVVPLPLTPDQPARLRAAKPAPPAGVATELSLTVRSLDDGLRDLLLTDA